MKCLTTPCLAAVLAVLPACSQDPPAHVNVCGAPCLDCTPVPVALPDDVPRPTRVLVDQQDLFLETAHEDSKGHYYDVYRLPLAGGAATPLWSDFAEHTDIIEGPPPGFEMAFSSVYLLGSGNQRVPLDGSAAQHLPPFVSLRPVFLADSMLVSLKSDTGRIVRMSPEGKTLETLYDLGDRYATSMALGGEDLFWVQPDDGGAFAVFRGSLGASPPVRVAGPVEASLGYSPLEISADARYLYYFTSGARLVRADHDGQNAETLTSSATVVRAIGDGCTLVSTAGLQGGVFILSDQGGAPVQLANKGGRASASSSHVYIVSSAGLGRVPRR